MSQRVFYPFYPERILWKGLAVLGGSLAVGGIFLVFGLNSVSFSPSDPPQRKPIVKDAKPLSFSLNLKERPITFPLPCIEPEMTFSFDPPRPDGNGRNANIFVRFKQSAQSKRFSLPCRIDLQFYGGKLEIADKESSFWLELARVSEENVQGVAWVETASKGKIEVEKFFVSPQSSPLQEAKEFPEGSPFRILAEGRWLGHDAFAEKYEGLQTLRIAIDGQPSSQILDLSEKDWIVWHKGCWSKGILDEKRCVIARIESSDSKNLILEGWDGETHVRLAFPSSPLSSFKVRGEEIFNSIRVRSEKQISCMMEKQCLVLRCGDWILKSNGRWKVLRKKEEKDSYKSGKLLGELFVFEKIESRQGQKFITGFLFNSEKSQAIPIDLAVHKHLSRKEAKEK